MNTPIDDGWRYFGKHAMRFEPPDLLLSRPDGDMSVEEVREFANYVTSLPKPEHGFFAIIEAEKGGRLDPAALKLPEAQAMTRGQRAVAYVKAKFYQRTLVGIFQRAAKLLNISLPGGQVGFFDTDAEARNWIDELRQGK